MLLLLSYKAEETKPLPSPKTPPIIPQLTVAFLGQQCVTEELTAKTLGYIFVYPLSKCQSKTRQTRFTLKEE